MALELPQGTKEYIVATVADALAGIADLATTTPQYKVLKADDSDQIAWTNITGGAIQLMKLYCMIDTNTPSLWPGGSYRLYLRFTTAPELPVLGPFDFEVVAP